MTRSILVADNSKTIQTVIDYTFRATEFEVFVTSTGQEALAWLNENAADLVVADVSMPQMDGYKLCDEIRSNSRTQHIPVLLLNGASEEIDDRRAAMVEANASMQKPFESQTLIDQVNQLCGLTAGSDLPATFGQQLAAERETMEPTPQELENAVEVPMDAEPTPLAVTEPAPENTGAAALGKMKLKRVATPSPASAPVIGASDSSSRAMSTSDADFASEDGSDSFEIDTPVEFEEALEQDAEQVLETSSNELEDLDVMVDSEPSEAPREEQIEAASPFNAFTDGLDVPSTGDIPADSDGLAELDMSEFDSLMPSQELDSDSEPTDTGDDFDLAVEEPAADENWENDTPNSDEHGDHDEDDSFDVALEEPALGFEEEEENIPASKDTIDHQDNNFDIPLEDTDLDIDDAETAQEQDQVEELPFEPAFGAPMSDIMAAAAAEDAHEAELLAASSLPEESADVELSSGDLTASSDDIAVDFDEEEAEEMLSQGGPTLEPPPSPEELRASAAVDVDVWSLAEPTDDDFSDPPLPTPAQDNWTSTPPAVPQTNLPTEIAAHGELPVAEALVDSQLEPAVVENVRTPISRDPSAVLNATAVVADAVAMVTERGAEAIAVTGEDLIAQSLSRDELVAIARDVMEKVAWEVIPELAETIIRTELEKLLEEQAQQTAFKASPGQSIPPPPPIDA
ncbi:MAG: response regulator [Myxococcota bacterium]|nr:response regulator [Myxococcota bacterium]